MMAMSADEPVAAAAVSEGVTTPPVAEPVGTATASMPTVASMATAYTLDERVAIRVGEVDCSRDPWHGPRLGDS
ncbi:MAG: hypothetical protein AB7K67_12865 [Hyphomicrobiaceae bacterium]